MAVAATALAVVVFLIPVAVVVFVRARPNRAGVELALDLPLAVALDLLLTLSLARVFRLEWAAVLSRAVWLTVAGAVAWTRRRQPPTGFGPARVWAIACLAGLLAVAVSLSLSHDYWLWDREWHVPFGALVRGQRLPFHNVYDPDFVVHYHYAGDVLDSMLQTFSGNVIHLSRAESVMHDILYGLTGTTIGLMLQSFRPRGTWFIVVAPLAVLLAGPITLRANAPHQFEGYADINNLTISFRPHVVVAALLLVGFAGALLCRLRLPEVAPRHTVPVLIVVTAALSITDEISTAVLGLALGATWLFIPELLHPRRRPGLAILVGQLAAILFINRWLSASLAPGGPVNEIHWVPGRNPGFMGPPLPTNTYDGLMWSLFDLGPILLVLGALLLIAWRERTREAAAIAGFAGVMGAIALVCFFHVEFNHRTWEGHRFVTCARFLLPLFAIIWLSRLLRASLPAIIMTAALAAGAFSTLGYVVIVGPRVGITERQSAQYPVDCRRQTLARFGEHPEAVYLSERVWYLYAGCHPIYSSGAMYPQQVEHGVMRVGWPLYGVKGLADLDAHFVAHDQRLPVICAPDDTKDPVCVRAAAEPDCRTVGDLRRCTLDASARAELQRSP